jgi:GR25 family glycosyltransferase involved in LPS biosynthesis
MHPIFKLFKKAFYINLDKRKDRRDYIEEQLGKIGLDAERFPGVESSETISGHRGCRLSHLTIIRKALDENIGNVLIIEDDCVFIDGFNEKCDLVINNMINVSPRWDLLFFYFYQCCNHSRFKNISPNLRLIQSTLGTHFYGINSNSLAKLSKIIENDNEFLPRHASEAIDRTYINNDTEIDVVSSMINLVSQKPGYSDTANNFVTRTTSIL